MMHYTIDNVPDELAAAIQRRAEAEHKSLNDVLLDMLRRGLGDAPAPQVYRDLSDVAGQCTIDDETRAAFDDQRQIDPDLWK